MRPLRAESVSGNRWFEMQFQSFAEVVESFFVGLSLARYIKVKALRNEPVPLSPNSC